MSSWRCHVPLEFFVDSLSFIICTLGNVDTPVRIACSAIIEASILVIQRSYVLAFTQNLRDRPNPVDWKIHNLGDLLKQKPQRAGTVQLQPPETDPVLLERERLANIVQDRLQALTEAKADLTQFDMDHR